MPAGGRIQIGLKECLTLMGTPAKLLVTIDDSGDGIPCGALDKIFEPGFTTHTDAAKSADSWPSTHRGLGLAITRSIVEKAGGRIRAGNRPGTGARFEIELPVRTR
jgi:signal transduction histidine kinase